MDVTGQLDAAMLSETVAFGELLRGADQSAPVPTCPEWNVKQLFRHLGRGNRWSAQIVAGRRTEPLDPREVTGGKPPEGADAEIEWLNDGAQALLDAVDRTGAQTPVWTFIGPKPAHWWIRRRVHETTLHRADLALALGAPFALDPELAADGITETLERAGWYPGRPEPVEPGTSLTLQANDSDAHWRLGDGPGVTVRGPLTGLLLAATRRQSAHDAAVLITGDQSVWQTWLDRTAY